MELFDLKSADYAALADYIASLGERPYRAKQLYEWMHVKQAVSIDGMTNLPKELRSRLARQCRFTVLRMQDVRVSGDGTRKYLFALDDGNVVESVFMRYKHGNSVCISSQAGCRMGCRFCASGIGGLSRNLTPAEMLEQVYRIGADIGERVSNVVVMGTGEPLDNYDNLLVFLRMLTDGHGLNISQRSVTVSTCGITPRILDLAGTRQQITLSLSLHAPTQEKREKLMPVARRYPLARLLDACDAYFESTGRRVTYEYALISGLNDAAADADGLSRLLKGKNCHVNLIPVNPVRESGYSRPSRGAAEAFLSRLRDRGINATIRREMGGDVDGACGQLRRRRISGNG